MEDSENKNNNKASNFANWLVAGLVSTCIVVGMLSLKESQKRTEIEKQFFTEVKKSLDAQYQKQEQLYSLVSDHFYFQEANIIAENAFKQEEALLILGGLERFGVKGVLDPEAQKKYLAKLRTSPRKMHQNWNHYLNIGYFPPFAAEIFKEKVENNQEKKHEQFMKQHRKNSTSNEEYKAYLSRMIDSLPKNEMLNLLRDYQNR